MDLNENDCRQSETRTWCVTQNQTTEQTSTTQTKQNTLKATIFTECMCHYITNTTENVITNNVLIRFYESSKDFIQQ